MGIPVKGSPLFKGLSVKMSIIRHVKKDGMKTHSGKRDILTFQCTKNGANNKSTHSKSNLFS